MLYFISFSATNLYVQSVRDGNWTSDEVDSITQAAGGGNNDEVNAWLERWLPGHWTRCVSMRAHEAADM